MQFERERYEMHRKECELERIEQRYIRDLERSECEKERKRNFESELAKFKLMMEALLGNE